MRALPVLRAFARASGKEVEIKVRTCRKADRGKTMVRLRRLPTGQSGLEHGWLFDDGYRGSLSFGRRRKVSLDAGELSVKEQTHRSAVLQTS
jgi:hypothetical protein